jgi:hypothetical protein
MIVIMMIFMLLELSILLENIYSAGIPYNHHILSSKYFKVLSAFNIDFFQITITVYKTSYLNKEVNRTDPSPFKMSSMVRLAIKRSRSKQPSLFCLTVSDEEKYLKR